MYIYIYINMYHIQPFHFTQPEGFAENAFSAVPGAPLVPDNGSEDGRDVVFHAFWECENLT